MNKRRRAYKRFNWKRHSRITAMWNYYSDVAKGKVTPSWTDGRVFVFRKTVHIGNEDLTMTVTALDKLGFHKELERRFLYGK